jgi:hypothetical protein
MQYGWDGLICMYDEASNGIPRDQKKKRVNKPIPEMNKQHQRQSTTGPFCRPQEGEEDGIVKNKKQESGRERR